MKLLKRLLLTYLLSSDERYLKACMRDSLVFSLDLYEFRKRMQEMRVHLALLEPRIRGGAQ